MRSSFEGGLKNNLDGEVEFLSSVLDVLEWGSQAWEDIPEKDKGVIFSSTFIRGVRSMHLQAYMKVVPYKIMPRSFENHTLSMY